MITEKDKKQVEELVEYVTRWLAYYNHREMFEGIVPMNTAQLIVESSIDAELRKQSKDLVVNMAEKFDLALIDRKPKCWHCHEKMKPSIVCSCGYSTAGFQLVIPLAEAIKEMTE